jgi:predicted alpha-1,6-mannanase (GH76 family)
MVKITTFMVTCAFVLACAGCNSDKPNTPDTPDRPPVASTPEWAGMADSCTTVLIDQFMDKSKGTFRKSPNDPSGGSEYIYWQQAHALDVVIYSYQRIKEANPNLAATYENYFERWFDNKANNYHKDPADATGFLNPFTDDMCWICLTLIHLTEATGDNRYIEMAKQIYDTHIITRATSDLSGIGLPWKDNDPTRNACTNAPGCVVAAKLYQVYQDQQYRTDAERLYNYIFKNLYQSDGRVEEPPLTYTQGTFAEACRQLYRITGAKSYLRTAETVTLYALTSSRCTTNGLLRDEGSSMDQSIFKAVLIPYAVNLALEPDVLDDVKAQIKEKLTENGRALRAHLDPSTYPRMYCNYYWGTTFPTNVEASMGAQTSGASLMEGLARLEANDKNS